MAKDESPDLRPLFHPSSVALIGASRDEGKSGGTLMARITTNSFKGRLYPVNPRGGEIMGLKAYSSVLDIPDDVDVAIITIPALAVPGAMEGCVQKGVKFVVVHSSGFREVGNWDLERHVVDIARRGGVRVVGPNCMGVFSAEDRLCAMDNEYFEPEGADVAFIAQSGTICDTFLQLAHERGFRVINAASIGNEADLTTLDYLRHFADDPKVRVIAAYMEGVAGGRRFIELAREVSPRKPIIVWKSGRTSAGARAIKSHTGSLAVADRVCESAFLQAGIVMARSLEELCDIVAAFKSPHLPRGRRVGILVDTGGGSVASADACESAGLEVPVFPEEVQEALKEFLTGVIPPFSGIGNPVDLVWPKYEDHLSLFEGCLGIIAGPVDSLLMVTFHPLDDMDFLQKVGESRDRIRKPLFVLPAMPVHAHDGQGMKNYTSAGMPSYPVPHRAARAILALAQYSDYLSRIEQRQIA